MNCQHCIEFIMAYLDGELSSEERAVFERHMSMCQSCWDYLESYRTTVGLCQSQGDPATFLPLAEESPAPEASPCSAIPSRLVEAILAARKSGGSHTA